MFKKALFILFIAGLVICNSFFVLAEEESLPKITIIATGGTIAGTAVSETQTTGYTAAALPVENLIKAVPELQEIAIIKGEQIAQIDSADITVELWLKLAKRINTLLASDDVDGIVITHGTDTLEETAYFLNLTVKSDKPVVLVGSMRPATAISADGPMNLYEAVILAGSSDAEKRGVLVMLDDLINSGREVTKTSTFLTDTFKTPDLGCLGYIQSGKVYFYRSTTRVHTKMTEFDITDREVLPQVEIVYGYGDSTRTMIDALVEEGVKGIVYAGAGNGNISEDITKALIEAREKGIVVVRSSRTGSGIVTRNGELNDDELGFVTADDLNPQKARILLMLALTITDEPLKIQDMFWKY